MKTRLNLITSLVVSLVAGAGSFQLLNPANTQAADGIWISDANGNWGDSGNWQGGVIADGAGSTAYFTNDITAVRTVNLESARFIGNVVCGDPDTNTLGGWLFTGSTLALSNSVATPIVTVNPINDPNGYEGTNDVRFNSLLVATNGFIKRGGGTLTVTVALASGLPGGAVQMDEGTIAIGTQDALARGHNLIYNGGTLRMFCGQSGLNNTLTNVVLTTGTVWSSGTSPAVPRNNLGSTPVLGNSSSVLNLRLDLELLSGANPPAGSNQFANFNGTLNIIGGFNNFRCDPGSSGNPLVFGSRTARLNLGGGTNAMTSRAGVAGANHTHFWGAVTGGPTTALRGSQQADNAHVTYQIGDANLDTAFDGVIQNGSTVARLTALTKSGTGIFTLNASNTFSSITTVANGTLALGPTGSINNTPAILLTSANAIFDVSAFDATGGWTNAANQILGGFGTVTGAVTILSGALSPGVDVTFGRLKFANDLMLTGTVTNKIGFATNDSVSVSGNLTLSDISTIQLVSPGISLLPNGTYVLFNWGGTLTGDLNNLSLSYPPQVGGATIELQTNLVARQILLVVSNNSSGALTWRGDGAANNWDHSTPNWRSGGSPAVFSELDSVTFDDSGSNNIPVNLTEVVTPSAVVVGNTNKDYVFSGGGKITGVTGLTKNGPGKLTVLLDNDFSGAVNLNEGTVQVGNGATVGSLGTGNFINNGTLLFNRDTDLTVAGLISGSGTLIQNNTNDASLILTANSSGGGGILVSGGRLQLGDGTSAQGSVTAVITNNAIVRYFYNADASLPNRLSGNGVVNYEQATGTRTYTYAANAVSDGFTGTINIAPGVRLHADTGNGGFNLGNGSVVNVPDFAQAWVDSSVTNYNQSFVIAGNGWSGEANPLGALRVFNCTLAGPITLTANSRIGGSSSGATVQGQISGAGFQLEILGTTANPDNFIITLAPAAGSNPFGATLVTRGVLQAGNANAFSNAVTLGTQGRMRLNGNNVAIASLSGGAPLNGTNTLVLNNSATTPATLTVGTDDSSTLFEGTFANGGAQPLGLTKTGAGTLTLPAISTSTGEVNVNGGTLQLTGDGSFSNSVVQAVASGAFLDVTSRSDGSLNLNNGQTLKGNGTVNGTVIALAGSTVAPGASVGTLNIQGNITLGGTLLMELNRTNTPNNSDRLTASGTITYGGTLATTNIGPALQVNDTFQLFPTGVSGFTSFNIATRDANNKIYTWQNDVAALGSIKVLTVTNAVNTAPTNITFSVSNGSLDLSWPDDHTGWTLQTNAVSLASTNTWFEFPAGTGSRNTNHVVIPIGTSATNVFFRLRFP